MRSGRSLPTSLFLLVSLGLLLGGCSPYVTATALPTPQMVRVVYTPAMSGWQPILAACAAQQPELALVLLEVPWPVAPQQDYDLLLQAAAPGQEFSGYAADLGSLEIVFAGANQNWTQASLSHAYRNRTPPPAVMLSYAPGSEYFPPFAAHLLSGEQLSPYVQWVASPADMQQALLATPAATGYLPRPLLAPGLSELVDVPGFEVPQVALAKAQPQGVLRSFLACLQAGQP
ncbi:MAG: hypothetical protein JW862_07145 [Anaerolineales bacterium]|nr:hypothetical protein [Anaerolineales bacterium]